MSILHRRGLCHRQEDGDENRMQAADCASRFQAVELCEQPAPSVSYRCHCQGTDHVHPSLPVNLHLCRFHHQLSGTEQSQVSRQKRRNKQARRSLKGNAFDLKRPKKNAHKRGRLLGKESGLASIGRKGIVENVTGNQLTSSLHQLFSPCTSPDSGPAFPQRKKLVAPRTPVTPSTQLARPQNAIIDAYPADVKLEKESLLEALPLELLVRIVCSLHHDQLKPAFHVCRRFRQAVLIAQQSHFDFRTPDHERQERLGLVTPRPAERWPFASMDGPHGLPEMQPATPRAPRHAPKPPHARIPVAEMKQVATILFQGPEDEDRSGLPRNMSRTVASHRVLFNEEELCHAVAQQPSRHL